MFFEKLSLVVITTLFAVDDAGGDDDAGGAPDGCAAAARGCAGKMLWGLCGVIWAVLVASAVLRPFDDPQEDLVDIGSRLTNSINCAVAVGLHHAPFGPFGERDVQLAALLVLASVNLTCLVAIVYSFNPADLMQKVRVCAAHGTRPAWMNGGNGVCV